MDNMRNENYIKPRKTRPNRRAINYGNDVLLKTRIPKLQWTPEKADEGFSDELDPTVPNERFDRFELDTLCQLAHEFLTKDKKDFDPNDMDALIAMTRYLNAERLAIWGSLVPDAGTVGDGEDVHGDEN